ncbi:methyltransferase [Scytonema hofmannii FACHB-248]|uniref:Methyltransferase n=1 Tax=Scytonema hofmannii FACHB-248 TaxID=1842502 RepID=A0ABR8GLF9_9CYAN|nr:MULTISPECIES: methyltransferase [Nostocales]MBD2603890.1 methyltransferase [Scytonema hofmannii FACHB-248]
MTKLHLQVAGFQELHSEFLSKQSSIATYNINGLNIIALPNIYHPEPQSSSMFFLKTIREQFKQQNSKKGRLLELGCGTGVIGLCCNEYVEELYLSDIDKNAVFCTQINAFLNYMYPHIYHSNLFESLPDILFDTILFNIPFLDKKIEASVEVATNDLDGQIFINFIKEIPMYLAPKGDVFFSYSNLGNLELFNKIPDFFIVEKIANEVDKQTGIDRSVFQMRMK